jgi:CHASE2 domain-containing sensor protein
MKIGEKILSWIATVWLFSMSLIAGFMAYVAFNSNESQLWCIGLSFICSFLFVIGMNEFKNVTK